MKAIDFYLNYIYRHVSLNSEATEFINTNILIIFSIIKNLFPFCETPQIFGSFSRSTALKLLDEESFVDIDILIRYRPEDAPQKFSRAILKNNLDWDNDVHMDVAIFADEIITQMTEAGFTGLYYDSPSIVWILHGIKIRFELNFVALSKFSATYGPVILSYTYKEDGMGNKFPELLERYENNQPGMTFVSSTNIKKKESRIVFFQPNVYNEIQDWASENFNADFGIAFVLIKYIAKRCGSGIPTQYLQHDFYHALMKGKNVSIANSVCEIALLFFINSSWHNRKLYNLYPEHLNLKKLIYLCDALFKQGKNLDAIRFLLKLCPPPHAGNIDIANQLLSISLEDRDSINGFIR